MAGYGFRRIGAWRVAVAAALAFIGQADSAAPAYRVEIVAPLAGHDSVFPTDMNEGGTIVGYAGSDPFDPLATPVVYADGRLVALPKPTDSLNFALGVGGPDPIVGSSSNQPYAWRRGVPTLLQPAGGLPAGFAFDASDAGMIVGAVHNDITGRQFPAFWPDADSAGVLLRGLRGLPDGAAFAINSRGQIGGAAGGTTGVFFGARWDSRRRAPRKIGPLPGAVNSEVVDLNDLGDAVGRSGYPDDSVEAMLYIDATRELRGLGFLDGRYSFANAINDARQVVGTANAGAVAHAFLWQDGTLYDLNVLVASSNEPFEYLSAAVAIDNQGRIAAEAVVLAGLGTATRLALLIPVAP